MQVGTSVLPLGRIRVEDALWPRLQLVRERVELFARLYEEHGPDVLPPIEVVPLPPDYLLSEGRTRYEAALQLDWESLPAIALPLPSGADPRTFAFDHALESCTRTSAPLTAGERKDAAKRLLVLHPDRGDAEVARALGVARTTVLRWRHQEDQGADAHPRSVPEVDQPFEVARRLFQGIEAIHGSGLMNALFVGRTGRRLADLFEQTYGERAIDRAEQFRAFLDLALEELEAGEGV